MSHAGASLGVAAVLVSVGLERWLSAALVPGRDVDFMVRIGIGGFAIALGAGLAIRWTFLRRSR